MVDLKESGKLNLNRVRAVENVFLGKGVGLRTMQWMEEVERIVEQIHFEFDIGKLADN